MENKRTILFEEHKKLGAKMVPFAGYEMPVQYKGIQIEHKAVRTVAGLFDVSHMGEFIIKGPNSLELVNRICTNDASKLKVGGAQYSCFTNFNGGIIDDLLVYRVGGESYMLVVNASNIQKDWNWIQSQNSFGVELQDISDRTALLALQGPESISILQRLTEVDLAKIPYYSFVRGEVAGIGNILISATGYTGAGGFELYFEAEHAPIIWRSILEEGKNIGIEPAGLGARDTLRLEMGYCLYGNDLSEQVNPLEAGLGWVTQLNKPFIGSEALKEYKNLPFQKKFFAFKMIKGGIPRAHYLIKNKTNEIIGEVSSGTQSPTLKQGIGMGYLNRPFIPKDIVNEFIYIEIRGELWEAKIIKSPFLNSKESI